MQRRHVPQGYDVPDGLNKKNEENSYTLLKETNYPIRYTIKEKQAELLHEYSESFGTPTFTKDYIVFLKQDEDNPLGYVALTFDKLNHQILGGAVMSTYDLTGQGNVLSLAISHRLTLEDFAEQDFLFSPSFDRQWSILNLAAQHTLGWAKF